MNAQEKELEASQRLSLKNWELFEGVDAACFEKMAKKIQEFQLPAKEILYTPEDDCESIYMLKRGEMRLYHMQEGKKHVFDVIGAGAFFGGFFSESCRHYAEVTQSAHVAKLSKDDFFELMTNEPRVMMNVLKTLNEKLKEYEARLKDRGAKAEELVLNELQRYQESKRKSIFAWWGSKAIQMTHEELAELTGLNRVTVTRSLKRLKELGKIQDTRAGIEIISS